MSPALARRSEGDRRLVSGGPPHIMITSPIIRAHLSLHMHEVVFRPSAHVRRERHQRTISLQTTKPEQVTIRPFSGLFRFIRNCLAFNSNIRNASAPSGPQDEPVDNG